MIILSTIGTLICLYIVYALVRNFNYFTNKKYLYKYFTWGKYFTFFVAYILIIIGVDKSMSSMNLDGNLFHLEISKISLSNIYIFFKNLSGILKFDKELLDIQIILATGIITILLIIYYQISETGILVGILGSIFQLTIYTLFFFLMPLFVIYLIINSSMDNNSNDSDDDFWLMMYFLK